MLRGKFSRKTKQALPFPGAERELTEYSIYRSDEINLMPVTRILYGQLPKDFSFDRLVECYVDRLNPETVNLTSLYERMIVEPLMAVRDAHLSIYPYYGTISTADRNAVNVLDVTDGNLGVYTLRPSQQGAFDQIIRAGRSSFSLLPFVDKLIANEIYRRYMTTTPADWNGQNLLLMYVKMRMRHRLTTELEYLHNMRTNASVPNASNGQSAMPGTGTVAGATVTVKDINFELEFLAKLQGEADHSEKKIAEELLQYWAYTIEDKDDSLRYQAFALLRTTIPTESEFAEAYRRGTVDTLPELRWVALFNKYISKGDTLGASIPYWRRVVINKEGKSLVDMCLPKMLEYDWEDAHAFDEVLTAEKRLRVTTSLPVLPGLNLEMLTPAGAQPRALITRRGVLRQVPYIIGAASHTYDLFNSNVDKNKNSGQLTVSPLTLAQQQRARPDDYDIVGAGSIAITPLDIPIIMNTTGSSAALERLYAILMDKRPTLSATTWNTPTENEMEELPNYNMKNGNGLRPNYLLSMPEAYDKITAFPGHRLRHTFENTSDPASLAQIEGFTSHHVQDIINYGANYGMFHRVSSDPPTEPGFNQIFAD